MVLQEEITMSINDPTPDEWDKASMKTVWDGQRWTPAYEKWKAEEEWSKERNRKACDTVESWTTEDYEFKGKASAKYVPMTPDEEYNTTTFGPLEHSSWQNESLQPVENPKAAIGAAKAPFFGIPWTAVIEMGTVMDGGAHKYGAYNYRDTVISTTTYHDAILRHFMLWADGEDNDPESKCSHLAHIMACCALMIDADCGDMLEDDRSITGNVRWMLDSSATTAREFRQEK
jgi:hypothetical protein